MPIDYSKYHPKWTLISRLIRYRRARNRCEQCGAYNGMWMYREPDGTPRLAWQAEADIVTSKIRSGSSRDQAYRLLGFVKIILTVAHMDHDRENNRFWNLKALCQYCHLNHDRAQHMRNRKYGRDHNRKHQLRLFDHE